MSEMYKYDAFISYRHLPLDEAVATKVQNLLERYRPPKGVCGSGKLRIERIFRDKTELPTSGDLDHALRNALLGSRYLIIILSEETKNSKWCMEEISQFKAAHGGRISHILPVLVSGEPSDSIPDLLRYETQTDESGNLLQVEVEPLCCDVRAESQRGSLQKLKTEFLRLAAPLLDCGFDDLYQRHKRRAKQQKMAAFCTGAAASILLGCVGYGSWKSYEAYRQNLLFSYLQKGGDTHNTDVTRSMMYFTEAMSLDSSSQAAETGTLMLLQKNIWLRDTAQVPESQSSPPAMPQYGSVLNAAEDRSCISYFDGSIVTLYFPASGSVWQIPVPENVNPACKADSPVESRPYAMGISESRAILRHNGYLYLYNLEPEGGAVCFSEFDLALVFRDETQMGNLDLWNETWADTGGRLAVLYNGATAAVFNVKNRENPCLNAIHMVYGYALNTAVFSGDGSSYALVYGNEYGINLYDPGGYVEVYDEYGNLRMATPLDAAMPPEGAAFSPDGSRLLVWGSGRIQIWDIATGTLAAAPLELSRIEHVSWTDEGLICVSDGSETARIFTPTQFTPSQSKPESPQPGESPQRYDVEFQLSDGFRLKHNYSRFWLEDPEGNQVGEDVEYAVNRMFAQPGNSTVYLWYDNSDTLLRVTIKDDRSGLTTDVLDTIDLKIIDVNMVPGGLVAFTGNDSMLYYPLGSTTPLHTMTFSVSGNIKSSAGAASGLFAVVLQSTQYYTANSHQFEYRYTLELWDLNAGICVARPECSIKDRPKQLILSDDGWLSYEKDGQVLDYLVSLPDADSTTAEYLRQIPSTAVIRDNTEGLQIPDFADSLPGNWGAFLTAAAYAPKEDTGAVQTYLQELAEILDAQGKEQWLSRYQEIWKEMETAPLSLDEMCDLFQDYLRTARAQDLLDQIRPGFACVASAVAKDGGEDWLSQYSFILLTAQYMLLTDDYDDIMIDYWLDMADAQEAKLDPASDDWFYDFVAVYNDRLYAALLLGYGSNAFYAAVDEVYHDSLATILVDGNLDNLFYMVTGKPDKAANSFRRYLEQLQELYSYDPEEAREEIEYAAMFILFDFNMLEQRGILSEADVTAFVNALPLTVGLKLTQVTQRNLEDGLYLGDIVTAVDGVAVFNQYHVQELMEKYPTASLTVQRGKQTFTTNPIENWQISGDFYAQ